MVRDRGVEGEAFPITLVLASRREVRLAASGQEVQADWLCALEAAAMRPPAPPPLPGTKNKFVAQNQAERQNRRLNRAISREREEARVLTVTAEALSLLLEAQRPSRAWSRAGFTADEVRCILEEGRMVVQRFARKEVVIQGGEPATYFGVVLQGTLAIVLDRQPVLKVAGDILGEMAYFLGGVRGADIVAASEGFVATMTYRQLEAFKAHPSQGARALAERLTDTLARCTLETQAAIEQGVAVEEVVLDDADVGRRLIALQKQQRSQNWTTRDHERSAPAEALYRRAHHGSTPQAPAAAPRAARIAPSGEDDGTGGDGGLLQGHLQLCKLLRVGQAGGEWEKRWCVLAGCHVHVYAQPQQPDPIGRIVLHAGSRIEQRADGSFCLSLTTYRVANASAVRASEHSQLLFRAERRSTTRLWARALRAHMLMDPSEPPHLDARNAPLGGHHVRPVTLTEVCGAATAHRGEPQAEPRITWREFGAASARLLAKLREVPHPFADDLEEGITVWQLSRAASRAIASLDLVWQHLGARATMPVLELRAEYAYVILNASYGGDGDAGEPSDATEEMHLERAQGDAQLRIRIHHWVGAKASHDARGAVAVLSIHLLQALESSDCTARLYLEEEAQESSVFLSYFPEQVLRVVAAASSAPVNRAARREERCCLWPSLPPSPRRVLYHVTSDRAGAAATPTHPPPLPPPSPRTFSSSAPRFAPAPPPPSHANDRAPSLAPRVRQRPSASTWRPTPSRRS